MSSIKKKKICKFFAMVFFVLISACILLPVIYEFFNAFMSKQEIIQYYAGVLNNGEKSTLFHILPDKFSLQGFYNVLLSTPEFLQKFWNSIGMCITVVAGQILISCMGGFAFSKFEFKGRKTIFFVLIILMVMPLQVTLVPNYVMFSKLKLLDTYFAIILPAMFLPFGTFFMAQIFKTLPNDIIDAAKMDGANTFEILTKILIPACKNGVICLGVLSFIDCWNMVEQPMTFLTDISKYPLSVFLANVNEQNFQLSFVCGLLALLPVLLMFLFFNQELVQGIETSGFK